MHTQNPQQSQPERPPFQYSLRTLLILLTLAAIALSLLRCVGPVELFGLMALGAASLVVIVSVSRRWLWTLGFACCALIGILATPADPLSALLVAVPLCCVYGLGVWVWNGLRKSRQRTTRRTSAPTTAPGAGQHSQQAHPQ
jgi:Sec-independent protein secretion pathway component TatC